MKTPKTQTLKNIQNISKPITLKQKQPNLLKFISERKIYINILDIVRKTIALNPPTSTIPQLTVQQIQYTQKNQIDRKPIEFNIKENLFNYKNHCRSEFVYFLNEIY